MLFATQITIFGCLNLASPGRTLHVQPRHPSSKRSPSPSPLVGSEPSTLSQRSMLSPRLPLSVTTESVPSPRRTREEWCVRTDRESPDWPDVRSKRGKPPQSKLRRLPVCPRCEHLLRGQDLNLRPPGYEPGELPNCSTPRHKGQLYHGMRELATRGPERPVSPRYRRSRWHSPRRWARRNSTLPPTSHRSPQ